MCRLARFVYDLAVRRVVASFVTVYRGMVWFGISGTTLFLAGYFCFALLIAVCVDSFVLLGWFFLLHVTQRRSWIVAWGFCEKKGSTVGPLL